MSDHLTPSKRPHEASVVEFEKGMLENGKNNVVVKGFSGVPTFRVLCPVDKINSVIGKDGEGLLCIERETGVKVSVEDSVSGCDERVIVIAGSGKWDDVRDEENKEGGNENGGMSKDRDNGGKESCEYDGGEDDGVVRSDEGKDGSVENIGEGKDESVGNSEEGKDDCVKKNGEWKDDSDGKSDDCKDGEGKDEAGGKSDENKCGELKESGTNDDSGLEKVTVSENGASSVRKALLLVFERMVDGETEEDGGDKNSSKNSVMAFRLLVLSNQVGCLLGRGGCVIKQMSSKSGAQIRIHPRDKLPACASASDELVQITGVVDKVRKALEHILNQLSGNSSQGNGSLNAHPSRLSARSHGQSHNTQEPHSSKPCQTADFDSDFPSKVPKFSDDGHSLKPENLSFRLLCPSDKVGAVIGKWGAIVKTIQQETGCDIRVLDDTTDSDDRIILISGPVHPGDRISAAQDALLRVQGKIMRTMPNNENKSMTARVLVLSNQIGCLLGKGGAIIGEMRKSSGANIRVTRKDQISKCASENEEVVEVNGELEAVQEALLLITTRLRDHFFRDHGLPLLNYPPAFPDHGLPFAKYVGRREISAPGMCSSLGLSFQTFDMEHGPTPHGGHHIHRDYPPFMHKPFIPSLIAERRPWGPQDVHEGGAPSGLQEFAGGQQRRFPGYGGASHPAVITSTTVEVVVPCSVVPAIYGEDGGCLKQIRQISDARVEIIEPELEAAETVIVISGTPDQTNAAQSLIQAFVMSETGPA